MNLKNYTTEVPVNRSIESIEKMLVSFGASNIMKEFSPGGSCSAISFIIEMQGMKLPFRLPAKVENVYIWLKKRKQRSNDKLLLAQAERITWKQLSEWLHLQLSMVEIDQAERLELFFPYLYDVQKRETYYDRMKQGKFKALIWP